MVTFLNENVRQQAQLIWEKLDIFPDELESDDRVLITYDENGYATDIELIDDGE